MTARLRRALTFALLFTTAGGGVLACGDSNEPASTSSAKPEAPKLIKLSIGYVPNADEAQLKLGVTQEIFRKNGIDLVFGRAAPTGAAQIAQLLNGQLDVGIGAVTGVMAAVSQGIPVAAVSALTRDYEKDGQTAYATLAAKDSGIQSFKDLEGKTVGINTLQGIWEIITREAVAKDGGDPSKVKLVLVPFPDQVTALKAGRVDAVTSLQPFVASLTADGFKRLGDPQAVSLDDPQSVSTVAYMSKAFIQKQPEAPKRWEAALAEASTYANAHPDEVRKAIITETKSPANVVNKAPVPNFTTGISRSSVDVLNSLMIKYKIYKKPVTPDGVLWSGTPSS